MPLYPKKNLLPPLTDSRWIIANPLKILSGYEAYLQSDVPAWDTSKVTIDVTVGETYYVQADIEGEFSVELWENGTVNLGSFARKDLQGRSFTARYTTWEVRIVRNAQATGYMKIKNFMVSKASYKQDFESYDLGMKRDSFKKDIVYPGISGSSHVATAADVFSVKRDVRVGKAQINIATTGVFKVAIYEWADGVGRIGNPIYQKDTTYDSTGVYTYDFGGVLLKAGKNYWIGRYEDTGGASANRTLTAVIPNETYKHVTWLGGTSFTSLTLAYPTTYYYFYGLEFEADSLKKAPLLPERNLIPDFTDKRWGPDTKLSLGGTTMKVDADNPHRGILTVGISAQSWMIQIPVKSGKTYTFQFGNITGLYRLLKGWTDSYNNVPIVGQDSKVLRITPDDSYNGYVTLRLTHGAAGDYRFEDLLMVEGDYTTVQQFTPYTPVKMKPALLRYTSKGTGSILLSDGAKGYGTSVTTDNSTLYNGVPMTKVEVVDTTGSQAKYGGTNFSVVAGRTYFLQAVLFDPSNVYRYSNIYHNVGLKNDLTGATTQQTIEMGNGYKLLQAKFTADFTGMLTHGWIHYITVGQNYKMWFGESTVQEGSDKTYELGMKPAILYPKKNYVLPFTEWFAGAQADVKIIERTNKRVLMEVTTVAPYNGLFMPLDLSILNQLRGKTVTLGVKTFNKSLAGQIQFRFTDSAGVNTEFVLGTSAQSASKFIPSDATAIFFKIQNNVVGTSLVEVDELQLEIGSAPTNWSLYELGMKQ